MPVTINTGKIKYKDSNDEFQTLDAIKGEGVPSGGTVGQVLSKASGTDYDTEWVTPSGGVSDVQVNGTSVVSGGVANVPIAGESIGVVKIGTGISISPSTGTINILTATDDIIKLGTDRWIYVDARRSYAATFYGLAKAAGANMKDIASTTIGVYPEAQKSAISQMLNGSVSVTGSTPSITALPGIRYVCGECTTLDITLPASGIVDVVFESGSTPTVLTATGVTWPDWFDPTALEANTTYEISIADGFGAVMTWA